jgi:hypothetical protein
MSLILQRCRVEPGPRQEMAVIIDGQQRLVWNGSPVAPRPFLYPILGPSGHAVTRMGHPGAPNHDHHRSVWFAHAKVLGIDFWSDNTTAQIRQKMWLVIEDGEEFARLAVRLGWYDGHDPADLIEQDVIFTFIPLDGQEMLLDVQTTLLPAAEKLELEMTNFGLLAVRMAKHLSDHFGGGELSDSEGRVGEPEIFGRTASWVDYSGPAPANDRNVRREGITFMDHQANPGSPTHWHVREDGWMGASLCMKQSRLLEKASPLRLHYGLYIHGNVTADGIRGVVERFHSQPTLSIQKGTRRHEQFEIKTST